MNIKKGITLIAVGFLFTLVNINITLNGNQISVTPDFIGWILFFLAFSELGQYINDKPYMKWLALVQVVLCAVSWILSIVSPGLNVSWLQMIINALSAVYMYILFIALEKVAADYNSKKEGTIRFLKYFNVASYVLLLIANLIAGGTNISTLSIIVIVAVVFAFAAAIMTAVVLFGLRKEINEKA